MTVAELIEELKKYDPDLPAVAYSEVDREYQELESPLVSQEICYFWTDAPNYCSREELAVVLG